MIFGSLLFSLPKILRVVLVAQVLDGSGGRAVAADAAWRMLRQIVEGLAHIHGNHVLHRDLTPNNIFADPTGVIKIGDFGLGETAQRPLKLVCLESRGQPLLHGLDACRGPGICPSLQGNRLVADCRPSAV